MGSAAGLSQQAIEAFGRRRLALGPVDADRTEEVGQGLDLLRRGGVVHAVDQGRAALLQGLGGRHVRLDHHLLDQPVGLERDAGRDGGDATILADDDPPLRAGDLQGRAGVAALLQAGVSLPERSQHPVHQGSGLVVGIAVDGGLGLIVGELGCRAHQAALEAVAGFPAGAVEHHPHRHAGPVLALAQAAQVAR